MFMMHTKLPCFFQKMKEAAGKHDESIQCDVVGLENVKTAKLQSARIGIIESEIDEMTKSKGVKRIEVALVPRIPETNHTVVIRAFDENNKPIKAVLDIMSIFHPTVDVLLEGCDDVEDRRPSLHEH